MGRYREVMYSLAFIAISYALFKVLNCSSPMLIAMLTPLIAMAHEGVHLIAIKMLKLKHRFAIRGAKVGFIVDFDDHRKFVACALSPQIITAALLALSIYVRELAVLALIHVGMSVHDIVKSLEYLKS